MYQVIATYEGLVHMMQDRFFNPEETEEGKGTKKAAVSWKEELPKKAYIDSKGVYVPADNIRMMLIGNKARMGAAKILGSFIEVKKGTQYLAFCKACVWVRGMKDPGKIYIEPKRKTFDDYDERTFPIKDGGRRLIRRPIIKLPWKLTFIVDVLDDKMDPSKVREFFEVGGQYCGVCAYGPTFGRCILTRWEIVEKKA